MTRRKLLALIPKAALAAAAVAGGVVRKAVARRRVRRLTLPEAAPRFNVRYVGRDKLEVGQCLRWAEDLSAQNFIRERKIGRGLHVVKAKNLDERLLAGVAAEAVDPAAGGSGVIRMSRTPEIQRLKYQ